MDAHTAGQNGWLARLTLLLYSLITTLFEVVLKGLIECRVHLCSVCGDNSAWKEDKGKVGGEILREWEEDAL